MLRKFLIVLFFIVCLLQISAFAYTHKLRRDWFNDDLAGIKKEEVTSITFDDSGYDKSKLSRYWNLDQDGLIAYVDGDTDIVISIPEDDILEADLNASGMFSFFIFNAEPDYETGDDGEEIKGLDPPDEGYQVSTYSKYISKLESINNLYLLNTHTTQVFDYMFMGLKELEKIDLSSMNTSNAISMEGMFMGCEKFKNIDISSLDTTKVTSMKDMFRDCKNLLTINTKDIKTDNLENMHGMFCNCTSLVAINLNNLNTKTVTDMSSMFESCENLEIVYIDKLDTKELRKTESMFQSCKKLKFIDLSNFNSTGLNNARLMFVNCSSLETLNLSSFKLIGKVDTEFMLQDMKSLKSLSISDSIAEKIQSTRLTGDWKNVATNKIYSITYDLKDKLPAGNYIKQ